MELQNSEEKLISSEDIAVVIQGAVDNFVTAQCIDSIRNFLPKAQIILSTWAGSNVSFSKIDKLVLSEDPGAVIQDYLNKVPNNANRQLLSTVNGLKYAQRKYALKIRTDFFLLNSNFLTYWNKFEERNKKFSFFQHRVLASSLYAREYSCATRLPLLFHPSDFWFFGLTEDLKNYFNAAALLDRQALGFWPAKYPNRVPYLNNHWRYAPEQYYCYSWARRYLPDIKFDDWTDWSPEKIPTSQQTLYNNFTFLDWQQSGFYSYKHQVALGLENVIDGLINHKKFVERYIEYCDPTFDTSAYAVEEKIQVDNVMCTPQVVSLSNMSQAYKNRQRMRLQYKKFFKPIERKGKIVTKYLQAPLLCCVYGIKMLYFMMRAWLQSKTTR